MVRLRAAVLGGVLLRARGGTLPTNLPTNTTSLSSDYYNDKGYTGTIPTEFGLMTAVTEFNLGNNELTGTIPVSRVGDLHA